MALVLAWQAYRLTTGATADVVLAVCLQVRAGEAVDNKELTKFAQLFNDELTLDNLERIHLVNLCRFVGIQPFGTDAFLVARLRSHLHTIKVRILSSCMILNCPLLRGHPALRHRHLPCGQAALAPAHHQGELDWPAISIVQLAGDPAHVATMPSQWPR